MNNSNEYIEYSLNTTALKKALENADYQKIHDAFSDAIMRSLQMVRASVISNLSTSLPKMSDKANSIAAEVNLKGDEGRVKIIKGKDSNYPCKSDPYWKIHFFELGTKVRKTKGHKVVGYVGKRLKRQGKGHNTGKIEAKHFLLNGVSQSLQSATTELENNLAKAITKAFENK